MSKKSGLTNAVSKFGLWLEQPIKEIKDAFSDMRQNSRERRQERRERQQQRRERHRMRNTIFGRQLLRMVIFSVIYWTIVWFTFNNGDLYYFMENALVELFYIIPGEQYLSDVPNMLIFAYISIMIVWPLVVLRRTANDLDNVYLAADGVLDKNNEIPPLPARINDLDLKLRSIRLSVIQNEQLAKEAEQRKNDLVVYLAHDLKTPLSSVIGYLTLLEELPDIPTEQRAKYTSITLDKAYRLEQLINEFFDITRFNLQSIELEHNRIDLSMMLMQIADEFYPVLEEKNLTINLKLPKQLMMVGDADKLMRVFDNLLRNAVSYSYENTEIILAARRTEESVEVICRNTGDMIPPQSLERLFEKFFRADSARHSNSAGSGLGLAIAKHIVDLHGGEISAQSTPEYTQFFVSLPTES